MRRPRRTAPRLWVWSGLAVEDGLGDQSVNDAAGAVGGGDCQGAVLETASASPTDRMSPRLRSSVETAFELCRQRLASRADQRADDRVHNEGGDRAGELRGVFEKPVAHVLHR